MRGMKMVWFFTFKDLLLYFINKWNSLSCTLRRFYFFETKVRFIFKYLKEHKG
jgi:hypothetical protein